MARKSEGLQSLIELASNAKNRSKRETLDLTAANVKSKDEIELQSYGSNIHKTENITNSELIRKKYLHQNRALAKNNSIMMSRISDMESKVNELMNENLALRKYKTFRETEQKSYMEDKMRILESSLIQKIKEIFNIFHDFRVSEGMQENPQLESFRMLLEDDMLYASTPIEDKNDYIASADKLSTVSSSADECRMIDDQIMFEEIDETTRNNNDNEVDLDSQVSIIDVNSSNVTSMKNEGFSTELKSFEVNKAPEVSMNQKHDNDPSKNTKSKAAMQEIALWNGKKSFDVFRESVQEESEPNVQTKSPSIEDKIDQYKSQSTEIKIEDTSSIARRSGRTKRHVSYKWPSLSKKMRRKSSKMVDAIFDENNPPSNKLEESSPGSHTDLEYSSTKRKRKRDPLANLTNSQKNTGNSISSTVSKIMENTQADQIAKAEESYKSHSIDYYESPNHKSFEDSPLAIFDFDEDLKPIKTYSRSSFISKNKNSKSRERKDQTIR